jgi:uncharacterized repeat protein (TIGR01451 family)
MIPLVWADALRRFIPLRRAATVGLAMFASVALSGHVAAAPPAGTTIGNQATASYLDATSTPRTATSNLVTTIVQQVASLTLTADGNVLSAPGGQAAFPHTLTNTGNGTDDFSLTPANLGGDDFDLAGLVFYADANGDGVPDNFTPISATGPLAAGAQFHFVAVGNVPGVQVAGDVAQATITAVSVFDNGQTAFNTDVVTVSGNAVLNVTKSINQPSGASPSGPYTYTLSYTNTGNATATSVFITDVVPVGMTYVPGSARWSMTGATVLTDASNADAQGAAPNTIIYDFGVSLPGNVSAQFNQIPSGASGTLTFQVNVDAGLGPQTITNVASFEYDDGAGLVGPFNTNGAPFTVGQVASLTFTGETIASALQGATVAFTNTLTNTGNGTDAFDVTLGAGTFPAGTSYALYQSDGVTPLTDTNANGTPDSGPLAAGASTTIVLRVTLPPGATGGPYQVDKTATSIADPARSAVATDVLTAIVASSVDLTNDSALPGAPGAGIGPEAGAVVTNVTAPGATTRFTLYVNNTSGVSDNYDLAASTDAAFAALTLPAGWSVTFRDAGNIVIANTGNVPAGGNALVYADVTVPAGFAPGTFDLYFRGRSPVSGALDRIHDAVTVSAVRSLTLVPNNAGSVAPGGAVTYTHLLSNTGNVLEGDGAGSLVALTSGDNQAGWSSVLYVDSNNNGIFDGPDAAIVDLSTVGGLAPGATVRLFARVFAPAGAPLGQVNLTSVTATTANIGYTSAVPAPAFATDNTTVLNGQLQITKRQVLDATCDGIPDGAYGTANITSGAVPGACLRYEITVTNVGSVSVTSVVVDDATPANTTYSNAVPASTTVGTITAPADGATGTVSANVGTLAPGASVVITFGVRIDP